MEELQRLIENSSIIQRDPLLQKIDANFVSLLNPEEIINLFHLPNTNQTRIAIERISKQIKSQANMESYVLDTSLQYQWVLSTGSRNIDSLLKNSGLTSGNLYLVYGKARSGKTQCVHSLCVEALRKYKDEKFEKTVLYIDSEQTFRPNRIIQMLNQPDLDATNVLNQIDVIEISTSSEFTLSLQKLPQILSKTEIKLIVIDSLTKMFRLALAENPDHFMEISSQFSESLKILTSIAQSMNIPIVCTSQVTAAFDKVYFFDIIPILSSTLNHYIKTWLLFAEHEGTLDTNEVEGKRYAHLVNSMTQPEKIVKFWITTHGLVDEMPLIN